MNRELYHLLPGRWRFERQGLHSSFSGIVQFEDLNVRLVCRETAELRDASLSREYIYELVDQKIRVSYREQEETRLLFTLDFASARFPSSARSSLQCGWDLYEGIYSFRSKNEFATTIRISGPSKEDLIYTAYSRISSSR